MTIILLYSFVVVAIKALNGPTIPWSSGRADALDPSSVTPDGRLPAADIAPEGASPSDSDGLRQVFYRMGAYGIFNSVFFIKRYQCANFSLSEL